MPNDPYDSFKSGIKSDVRGVGNGLFAGVGLLLFIVTITGTLVWFFLKENNYSTVIKATVGIITVVLVLAMVISKQLGNFIYLCWLNLLRIIFILLCLGFMGAIVYSLFNLMKKNF